RSPSPRQRPRGVPEADEVYVLTVQTDKGHHDRMTRLRTRYFPAHLNKLEAHLTLFHALPASKLQGSIIPALEDVASRTSPYKVVASKVMRMKRGMGIVIAKNQGASQTQQVHRQLKGRWEAEGWLSEQDRGGCHVHYTVMNKVDDEAEVIQAQQELERTFRADTGTAEGLGLWKYERGWWHWERGFSFDASQTVD
ncbi:hypothetical protein BAUCODRAFT_51958, partial [Baudoinia panamericana UAMH 10762]